MLQQQPIHANGHSVDQCRHRARRDYLAIWMSTGSSCGTATGQLRPAAWCVTTWVTGSSQLFRSPGRAGLERRIRPVWTGAVRVAGADFGAVAARFEKDGSVEGWAAVTGTWSGEQLRVERQDAPVSEPAVHARWVTPPCPAPDGGWPATERRGDIGLSYDLGDLTSTGAATAVTLFHPSKNQAVLVVAAADLAAVEAQLRPQLGTSLCVVPSRWTQDQLDAVRDHLDQRWQHWNLLRLGPQHDQDGQAHIAAGLVPGSPGDRRLGRITALGHRSA